MTLEKQTFTCDQTGEKFEVAAWSENNNFFIKKIEAPKIFPWDEVADGVLVYVTTRHFLFDGKIYADLKLSDKWQVWMGGDQPLPDGVLVEVKRRSGAYMSTLASLHRWEYIVDAHKSNSDIIAFRVLTIGDYKYPDEV